MQSPVEIISSFYHKINRKLLLCFSTATIGGFLTHFYMLVNKLPNWDDINNFGGPGVSSLYGRWFLDVLHPLSGTWSNPWLNGSVAIILLAFVCCILYMILELKTSASAIILPAIMMTFPSVASTMCFMFTVDLYACGLIFACLGVYVLRKYKYGCVLSFILFLLCLGTYQCYICFSIALLVFGLIMDLLNGKDVKSVFLSGIKSAATLLVTIIVYLPMSRAINPNMTQEAQNGIGNMASNMTPAVLIKQALRTFKRMFEYFISKPYSYVSETVHVVNILICIMIAGLFLWLFIRKGMHRNLQTAFLYVLCLFLLPVSLAFFYVMSPEANYSTLMYYQYALVYLFLLVLLEKFAAECSANT
ncbi:MAG: glucosyltransferase domain-containing protein, partial [Lachnospiraceae bacterium]|nr:glucosyltransferase domain-containing protein [Lachnospiraceae bacterium]